MYQDLWVTGKIVEKGDRECAHRYAIIKEFCSQYQRPFSVLDIGAAEGYFCIRLAEDFDCTAVGIESDVIPQNLPERVIWLNLHVTLDDLRALAEVEHFDVVLALSVIHHFGGSFEERMKVFKSLGDHLIFELAYEDAACGGEQKKFTVPPDAMLLGQGDSHLEEGGKRDIFSLSAMKTSLIKAYLESPRPPSDLQMVIYSDFLRKRCHFWNKTESRDWVRGINLWTYLKMGGVFPARERIVEMIGALRQEAAQLGCTDQEPWNLILQGDAVQFIDVDDPNMQVDLSGPEHFNALVEKVRML